MKFTCNLKNLLDAVTNVSLPISSKSNIPALEGILLECADNKLKLTGYDLDFGITKTIDVQMIEEGALVLNAKLFSDILRKMPKEELLIASDNKLLTQIKCGEAEFNILGMDRAEYPDMPVVTDSKNVEIENGILKNMILQTLFAVSTTDQTPIHTGSLFDLASGILHVVSVDGYRLALRKEPISSKETFTFVVPGKTLSEITKLLSDDSTQPVLIHVSRKHIIFEIDGYFVISRLLEGDFLDYKATIPQGHITRIHVDTKLFTSSIERTSIIINDRSKSPVKLVSEGNDILLSCESTIGKVSDKLTASLGGDPIRIAFNNKYMIDALKHTDTPEIYIDMNGALSPIKIVPTENDHFLYLVLPVRLKNEN